MMNQAASATRRLPADSSTNPGCCPMFQTAFFGLPTPTAAPQCFLNSQAQQLVQLARQPLQQPTVVIPPQQQTVSQHLQPVAPNGQQPQRIQHQPQQQQQPQSQPSQRSQDLTSNNYSTSVTAPSLSLQHLLTSRQSASSCMALAAALASASFPHFQQQQQITQNHQAAAPINQPTNTTAPTTTVNQVTQPQATPSTLTNQVPILNYNGYSSAQPFLTLPTLPPVAAHLSSSASPQVQQSQQQQPQPQTNIPPMPFYSFPQMEQALALLTNPQVANNIFSHVFNIYLQSGLRTDPHQSHHHHNPPHHFHHHLHGAHHHHHHHGQNGQANGQDATMPLDSLAISESKPRGLNRTEIDSLTPYIHTNEKDARTCVICLSKFELKSKIRPLPCNHAFHAKCVDKWLRANRTCPICRRDALKTFSGKIKRI